MTVAFILLVAALICGVLDLLGVSSRVPLTTLGLVLTVVALLAERV
jgi:hypothetical protein